MLRAGVFYQCPRGWLHHGAQRPGFVLQTIYRSCGVAQKRERVHVASFGVSNFGGSGPRGGTPRNVTTKPTPDTVHSPTAGQIHVESIQLACTCALCCCYAFCMKREELSIFRSLWLRCFVVMLQYVGFLGRSQLFGSQVKVLLQVGAPSRKLARQKSGVGAPSLDLARANCPVGRRQVRLSRAPGPVVARAISAGTLGARQLDSFGVPSPDLARQLRTFGAPTCDLARQLGNSR